MDDQETLIVLSHGDGEEGAAVLTGTGVALNMDTLALAGPASQVLFHDASLVRVDNGGGRIDEFGGTFTYGTGALPTGGLLSSIREYAGTTLVMSYTIPHVEAGALFGYLVARNTDQITHALFGGPDEIGGGTLADTLNGFLGNDFINAGEGNDFVRGLDGNDFINGDGGADDINGNTGDDLVSGGLGDDTVRGGQGADTVLGGDGNDGHLNGNIGDDLVFGGDGADALFGGQGSDTLRGDDGADTLSGDLGNDILYGGAGADRFLLRTGGGIDWVADFNAVEGDKVQLLPFTAYTVTNVQGQVMITLASGDAIGLAGVAFASFSTDWLAFA